MIRASLSIMLEHSTRTARTLAADGGETRRLGITRDQLLILREVTGARGRASDGPQDSALERMERAAAESCGLA